MESLSGLEERVAKLESRLAGLEQTMDQPVYSPMPTFGVQKLSHVTKAAPHPGSSAGDSVSRFMTWLKEDFMMKVGAFLLLLAFVWFVRYAFAHNWIGPVGRITLGIIVSLGFLVFGHITIPKRPVPGQVLVATGTTMFLVTIFAARTVYDFFTPVTALAAMGIVVAGVAAIAVIRNTRIIAQLALVGGAVAPILTNAPHPDYVGLLSYIFVLSLGVLAVVVYRGWRSLIIISLLVTWMYSFVFDNVSLQTAWLFMALFYLLYFGAGTISALRTKKVMQSDMVIVGINGLFLIHWNAVYVPGHLQALVMIVAAVISVVVAYSLFSSRQQTRLMIYLHAALAAVFIAAAAAFELEGAALVIAWSIEILAAVLIAIRVFGAVSGAAALSLLHVIPVYTAVALDGVFEPYYWIDMPLLNEKFFELLVLIGAVAGTVYLLTVENKQQEKNVTFAAHVHTGILTVLTAGFLWFVSHNLFESSEVARGVALVVYTIAGIAFFFRGVRMQKKPLRVLGSVLLAGVVVRLLLVEIWDMPLSARIITFVVVGVLLVSTAFYTKKKALIS